jgi:hypothetical protein
LSSPSQSIQTQAQGSSAHSSQSTAQLAQVVPPQPTPTNPSSNPSELSQSTQPPSQSEPHNAPSPHSSNPSLPTARPQRPLTSTIPPTTPLPAQLAEQFTARFKIPPPPNHGVLSAFLHAHTQLARQQAVQAAQAAAGGTTGGGGQGGANLMSPERQAAVAMAMAMAMSSHAAAGGFGTTAAGQQTVQSPTQSQNQAGPQRSVPVVAHSTAPTADAAQSTLSDHASATAQPSASTPSSVQPVNAQRDVGVHGAGSASSVAPQVVAASTPPSTQPVQSDSNAQSFQFQQPPRPPFPQQQQNGTSNTEGQAQQAFGQIGMTGQTAAQQTSQQQQQQQQMPMTAGMGFAAGFPLTGQIPAGMDRESIMRQVSSPHPARTWQPFRRGAILMVLPFPSDTISTDARSPGQSSDSTDIRRF